MTREMAGIKMLCLDQDASGESLGDASDFFSNTDKTTVSAS